MADPISAGVMIAGTAVGGIVGGIGAQQAANAQAQASQYKAGIALLNKQIAEQNAQYAVETGDIKAQEVQMKTNQEIANTTVDQAASGFDITSGTNVAVRKSQQLVSDFDQNVIRWDAAKTAWGYEARAATDQGEAGLDTLAAANERTAGTLAMTSSFINAGTSVASKWYQGSSQGLFNFGSGVGQTQGPGGLPAIY